MKKIVLSMAAVASVVVAGGDIAPVEPVVEVKSATPAVVKSFMDRIDFKGDMRLRYESIERDDSSNTYRNRYRLRIGSTIDLVDNLKFEVGMRSGFANPTSGNQTFLDDQPWSDYFLESLRFNVLGLSYTLDNVTVKVGRQPYMMYRPIKSQLVWDNDISLDGINYQYQDDTKMITAGINQPSYAENIDAKNDVNLFLAQYVQKSTLGDAKLNLGTGLYYYDGIKGNTPLYSDNKGTGMGNTLVGGVFANDYHIVEGFGELKFKNVLGKPFAIAAGVAYNTAADDNNFGYDVAFQLGKAKNIGDWQVKYSYTDIQEDAVLGAHSDSDNFGGGTAAKGHAIRTKYKFGKNTYLAGTFFFNTLYGSKVSDPADADPADADYERVQLDAIIKF